MTSDRMSCAEAIALAKWWARKGIHAFPIAISWDDRKQATNKEPLTTNGFYDATTDPAELERLFNARSPRPGEVWGVGLWPGPSGHLVLDPDIKHGERGDEELAALEAKHAPLDTLRAITASGGGHVYLKKPAGVQIGNDDLAPGVNVRADLGYVVAIGTRTPWGSWDHDEATPKHAIPAPVWLLDRLAATNGNGGGKGKWSKIDRDKPHQADLAALEALEALGGHDPYIGGDGAAVIVRPGKTAGGSASIGHIAPGVVKMFTDEWEIPGTNVKFASNGRYDADVLQAIVNGRGGPHLIARLLDPLPFTNGNSTQPNRQSRRAALRLTRASSIRIGRPTWVWDRRIPVGGTTLMPGREGLGKTALVCWIAARLSRGDLPGEWDGRPGDVIYVGHEDDRATVLVPRLTAAGADLDRFHFVDLDSERGFAVAEDVGALTEQAKDRPVALVVVDPLDSHLGHVVDSYKKAEVESTIARLADLAQELRCGALGLAHLNKAAISDLLAKVAGSVGFTTSVRSVLAVGEHPDDQNERVCVVAKANMTDKATVPAIRFRVEGATVDHPDDPYGIDSGRVVILGEQMGINPDTLLVGNSEERSKLDAAVDWLTEQLSGGPVNYPEIERAATARGISRATLHRAREKLGGVAIEPVKTPRGQSSSWRITATGVRLKAVETNPLETNPNVPSTRDNAPDEGGSSQVPIVETNPLVCTVCGGAPDHPTSTHKPHPGDPDERF